MFISEDATPPPLTDRQTKANSLSHYPYSGEKRFVCQTCGKRFMRSDHLNKHVSRRRRSTSLVIAVSLRRRKLICRPTSNASMTPVQLPAKTINADRERAFLRTVYDTFSRTHWSTIKHRASHGSTG